MCVFLTRARVFLYFQALGAEKEHEAGVLVLWASPDSSTTCMGPARPLCVCTCVINPISLPLIDD